MTGTHTLRDVDPESHAVSRVTESRRGLGVEAAVLQAGTVPSHCVTFTAAGVQCAFQGAKMWASKPMQEKLIQGEKQAEAASGQVGALCLVGSVSQGAGGCPSAGREGPVLGVWPWGFTERLLAES